MSDKPKTRVFNIPGDLLALHAFGLIRPGRWTGRMLTRRLEYLHDCIAADVVPDAKGRRERSKDGRKGRRAVPVPDDLAPHMADLAQVVAACRALLDAGDIAAAGARMDGIEALVADMAWRATPASETTRKAAAKGGRAKRKPDTRALVDFVDSGHSYGQAGRKFGLSRDAAKKRYQRNKK